MKHNNKVLQFAQAQIAGAWRRFQLLPPRPSLDPNQPPHYMVEAQGERADGTVFSVHMAINKPAYDLLHGQQALMEAAKLLNNALQQLQTYTGCACKAGEPCEQHKQSQVVN